jgi:phosphoribosyl 1,2-cyclic phosphodiesterase
MPFRFTVLASGSAGNASLLQAGGFGVLIDAGLGPRQLGWRLAEVGLSWRDVDVVLLTHTHGDHWRDRTLAHLRRLHVPIYCHPDHHEALLAFSAEFPALCDGNLVRTYEASMPLILSRSLACRPVALRHDAGATFGFRFEGSPEPGDPQWALGYAADLGSWTADLARELADVDLLAVEFNHDVDLEKASGRPPYLIARVLGDEGHLSNQQAAALLDAVLRASRPGRMRQLVQLHLSRECNRPDLAAEAARSVLSEHGEIPLHTAAQDEPGPTLPCGIESLSPPLAVKTAARRPLEREQAVTQRLLPGFNL